MFRSHTYGKVNIEQIPEKLLDFYNKVKEYDTPIQIIVGTDSQNHSMYNEFNTETHSMSKKHVANTKMVSVIAILCERHGGIYFYEISRVDKISDVRQKLYTETESSLNIADKLLEIIESDKKYEEMYLNTTFTIHVDAGHSNKGKTADLIPSLVGWITSQGFEYSVKPDSFVASTIADRISK